MGWVNLFDNEACHVDAANENGPVEDGALDIAKGSSDEATFYVLNTEGGPIDLYRYELLDGIRGIRRYNQGGNGDQGVSLSLITPSGGIIGRRFRVRLHEAISFDDAAVGSIATGPVFFDEFNHLAFDVPPNIAVFEVAGEPPITPLTDWMELPAIPAHPDALPEADFQWLGEVGAVVHEAFYEWQVWVDEASINCGCDCGYPTETLAQLRNKVAIAMGYSSQLASLPVSFKTNVDMQLNLQQKLIAADILEITGKRYFTWDVEPGETMFCTTENLEQCRNALRASRINEVWIVYDDNIRQRLHKGISFGMGTSSNPRSLPWRYDVRSCIEIWPPPDRAMKLVVFGQLAPTDMVGDNDKCTVEPTALLVRTLAFLKGQKGHADANTYAGQYQSFLANLNADQLEDTQCETIPPSFWDRVGVPHDNLVHHIERTTYGDDP